MLNKTTFVAYRDQENIFHSKKEKDEWQEVKFAVYRPNQKVQAKAQEIYNKRFCELLRGGALTIPELDKEMERRKLWDDERKKEAEEVRDAILANEKKLLQGGKLGLTKLQGKKIAIQMIKDRMKLNQLTSDRNVLQQNCAENQAENARFNFYIFSCTKYDDSDKHYFENYEEFLEKDDIVVGLAGNALMSLMYQTTEIQKQFPEWKFLLKYGFCNDKLQFVRPDKRLCDEDGRLLDETGRFINEKGEFVDKDGNRVNEDGTPVLEFEEFLDDAPTP